MYSNTHPTDVPSHSKDLFVPSLIYILSIIHPIQGTHKSFCYLLVRFLSQCQALEESDEGPCSVLFKHFIWLYFAFSEEECSEVTACESVQARQCCCQPSLFFLDLWLWLVHPGTFVHSLNNNP